jgi:DNA-binding NarL/FixJ family response regulator
VRVFIAEADKEMRLALQVLLHQEAGVYVTGMAVQTKGLVEQVTASEPDVLLLDWHLPGDPVLGLLGDIHALKERPKIVALSVRCEEESEILASGADYFICKDSSPDKLNLVLQEIIDNVR